MRQWPPPSEEEEEASQDDRHPTGATVVASLPPPAALDVHSIADEALSAYVDWLWGPAAAGLRELTGQRVEACAVDLRRMVHEVMSKKGLSVYTLRSLKDIRDFFSGQQDAIAVCAQPELD